MSNAWQSMEDKKITNQCSMTVLTTDQRFKEDQSFFKRERDNCMTIEVRGATGRKAAGINGVYEPTEDCCGGWPVYRKINDDEDEEQNKNKLDQPSSSSLFSPFSSSSSTSNATIWMEYNPYFRSWQIKPTPCLGTNRSWGYSNTTTLYGTLPHQSR